MVKKQFVIGMDGGATKTAAMLSDLSGNVLVEETGGPDSRVIHGHPITYEEYRDLIKQR